MNLELGKTTSSKAQNQMGAVLSNVKFLAQPHVVAAVFLLLYVLFGLIQYNQSQEQKTIASELVRNQRILRKVPQDKQELEDRLVSAQQFLVQERETFPLQQPTNVLLDSILHMAGESGIQVVNTKIIAPRQETIGQLPYVVSPFDVQARGSMSQVSSFLHKLEKGPLPTVLIGAVNLSKADQGYSLGVSFNVYGRSALVDTTPPTSRARDIPQTQVVQGQVQAYVPYVAWDEQNETEDDYSGVAYVELYFRVHSSAKYSKYTTLDNPSGSWTESPIPFTIPYAKTIELYTMAVDNAGNIEEAPALGADVVATVEGQP